MSEKDKKKKMVGPWRTFHAVIWLVGLYLLFSRGYFFPGILILLAISALYEALLARFAPHAFEFESTNFPAAAPVAAGASVDKTLELTGGLPANQVHRLDLLPQACPSCNGPIRGHEVRWTSSTSANCPYCGTNLPMKQV